jgi:hypothetical protein
MKEPAGTTTISGQLRHLNIAPGFDTTAGSGRLQRTPTRALNSIFPGGSAVMSECATASKLRVGAK